MKETEKTVSNKGSKKELPYLTIGDDLRVFLFLRRRSGSWYTHEDLARDAGLEMEAVKSAVKTIRHHPLIETEKDEEGREKVGFFRLLRT
ncbi:hypothetical protein MUO83_03050 [Candidatus Bathyarchaeota archaeon]|nr:hypothetical protein [Candidatus Bathyarchaeota archaeon]